jgi:tetratricopeptide (TPR) repeat protein
VTDFRQALIGASEAGDADLVFDIRHATAYAHVFAEQVDEARKIVAELEPSVEPPPGGSKRLRYLILDLQLMMGRGDLDQAEIVGDSAVALARALGDSVRLSHSLSARAQLNYYRAEYSSALSCLREVCNSSAAVTRRLVDPRPLDVRLHGTFFLGLTLGDLGLISEALSTLQSGLEIARQDGYGYWVPQLLNAIGRLYGEIGAIDAALQHDEEAAGEPASVNMELRVESKLNLVTDCLRLGQLDRASRLLAEAEALTRQGEFFAWLVRVHFACIAAEDALARGAPAHSVELAREGDTLARRYGVWKYVILAQRMLAEAAATQGDWSRAEGHCRYAIDVLTLHPVPIIAWKVHATVARIHKHRGLEAEAAVALDQARADVRQLSEGIFEEPLKTIFLQSPAVHQIAASISAKDEIL